MKTLNAMAFLSIAALAASAKAGIDSPTPNAFGGGRQYSQASAPIHFNSFFDIFVDGFSIISLGPSIDPPPQGTTVGHEIPSTVSLSISHNGGPVHPVDPPIPCEGAWELYFPPLGAFQINYTSELVSMNLVFTDPGLGQVMIRESPTLASTGQTHVQDTGGGLFHIDSFFDVFTELSTNGGATWTPASGPIHMEIAPAPGAAALLGLGGLLAARRRR